MLKNIFGSFIYVVVFALIMALFKRPDLFGFSNRSTLSIILESLFPGILFFVII